MSKNISIKNYRVWPIFSLAFTRLFYNSIFERSLSNYLLFIIGINKSTLGFITSAGALAYIVAPIMGQYLTSKFLGNKKALILSCAFTPVLTGAQILYPEPGFLLFCRILLGLSLGMFWPNMMFLLSQWEKVSTIEKSKKNFALFNFSWNIGFIGGLMVGFFWVLVLTEYSAMVFSWIISIFLVPLSFFLQRDDELDFSNEDVIYQTEDPLSHLDIEEDLIINAKTPMTIFPALFSWINILYLTIAKSIFLFGYPIILNSIDFPSYYTYIVQGLLQLTQLIGLTLINYLSVYKRKIASLLGTSSIVIFSILIFNGNIWFISVLSSIVGLFLGFIHGVGMKIMLEYGAEKNTSKYATINEIVIGIGFGITPIVSGYIVESEIYGIYWIVMLFGILAFISLLLLARNVKKN